MFNKKLLALFGLTFISGSVFAQDLLPADNSWVTYHTAPRYRESESHPLRVAAYIVHPIGWAAREVVFRPLSYFASSTEVTRSVMGYREPFDYRQPECFSPDDSAPDCRSVSPFNYDNAGSTGASVVGATDTAAVASDTQRQVYFPDVNFDFNKRNLNDLGVGRAHQLAALLKAEPGLKVVLQGNADYKGTETYNEKLGLDRAEAVRQELVSLGVPADRLSTVTFGESQPVLPEQEAWARAVNRRVAVQVEAPEAAH
ncbi:MAG: OmpA family protein [Deltaproteobacteria bacterium]|nr:OmpA family protein [Deltaproteobacteria bacterium]